MNCKRVKTQIALLIGNDLDPVTAQSVRKHLDECAGCRQHLQQLSSCLEALQGPVNAPWTGAESLWPELSAKLATRAKNAGETEKPHRLNGWAPTVAVAAACALMFWLTSNQQSGNQGADADFSIRPTPVSMPAIPPEFFSPRAGRNNDQSDMFRLEGQDPSRLLLVPGQEQPEQVERR
jgi:hypothetical protein